MELKNISPEIRNSMDVSKKAYWMQKEGMISKPEEKSL